MDFVTVEFAVDLHCTNCETNVKKALSEIPGIRNVVADSTKEQVLVESSLPAAELQNLIEKTGKRAVLRGIGNASGSPVEAAVAEFYDARGVKGVTRFLQLSDGRCLIDGTLDGLLPGKHGFAVCESGDLSNGCDSIGDHYNPHGNRHGHPDTKDSHVGDLGNISADKEGRAMFRFSNYKLRLSELVGRSLAVHENEDDHGKGEHPRSQVDGAAGSKIACAIIARSAGLMENSKKICTCSGETLWQEREEAVKRTSETV